MNRAMPERPVPVQYDQLLLDLKARQQAGEHMPCPRCGKDTMLCRRRYAGARLCMHPQ